METNEYRMMYALEQTYWWFVGKQFLVEDQLERLMVHPGSEHKILDIGSGTGSILKTLERFGHAFGMEVSWEAMRFLKKRNLTHLVSSDANHPLPFKDGTFSVITCLDVLEHLDKDALLIEEMFRVTRSGGVILITVPAYPFLWSKHDVALHHKRRYTRRQILRETGKFNCRVLRASYYNTLLFAPILVIRKMQALVSCETEARSDFYFSLPPMVNQMLSALYKLEISCLRHFNFPFGVSLLLVLKKLDAGGGQTDLK